ncbi:hypothetical protein V8E36_003594 [Tilletia maclaganii]
MSLYPLWSSFAMLFPWAASNPPAPAFPDQRARDITGFHAIVTGANSGVGASITKELVRRGASVTMACRSTERAQKARQDILDELAALPPGSSNDAGTADKRLTTAALDTNSLASVRAFAKGITEDPTARKIDLVYLNAGIAAFFDKNIINEDGFETLYTTNFLGHFLLLNLLEPRLAEDARIILTSSFGAISATWSDFSTAQTKHQVEPGFHVRTGLSIAADATASEDSAYRQTKGMQVILARALNERAARTGSRRIAFAFHPGLVSTAIFTPIRDARNIKGAYALISAMERLVGIKADKAAYTPIMLGTATEAALGGKGRWSQIWERSLPFASVSDRPSTARFWERWCNDAEVSQDWTL